MLERRAARDPQDGNTLGVLALAYQQRARETGDPAYYRLSELALQRATTAHGPLALIVQGEASLANTRHRFALGLRLARRAVGLDHYNGSAYAALGDALFNLGRYRAAFRVYDHIVNGVGQFEVHMGPRREFAIFKGVQDVHHDHDSPENLLKPFRVPLEFGRAKQEWKIPSLNLAFSATLTGGSRTDCESWFLVLTPLEKTSH